MRNRIIFFVCLTIALILLCACGQTSMESDVETQSSIEVETEEAESQNTDEQALAEAAGETFVPENGKSFSLVDDILYYDGAVVDTSITTLELAGAELSSYDFLTQFTSLERLILEDLDIVDLTPVGTLTQLEALYLSACDAVTDLSPLAGLESLEELYIYDCSGISDCTPLEDISSLVILGLDFCTSVTDLNFLYGVPALQTLSLYSDTRITDFSPLEALPELQVLNLVDTSFVTEDLPLLSGMTAMEDLSVPSEITDCSALLEMDFPNLRQLFCGAEGELLEQLQEKYPDCLISVPIILD